MEPLIKPASFAHFDAVCSSLAERPAALHLKRFQDQEQGHSIYFFAWIHSHPVGHVIVRWPTWPERPGASEWQLRYGCCFVEDLWVEPGARDRGVGRALMGAVDDACHARRHVAVGLHVGLDAGYDAARHIYETTGYRDMGHGEFIESAPGTVEPVVFLLRELRPT